MSMNVSDLNVAILNLHNKIDLINKKLGIVSPEVLDMLEDVGNLNLAVSKINTDIENLSNSAWEKAYPIGSIYMSVNKINPQELFGGTWIRIKEKFLFGAVDDNETNSDKFAVDKTGGALNVTLNLEDLEHYHTSDNEFSNSKIYNANYNTVAEGSKEISDTYLDSFRTDYPKYNYSEDEIKLESMPPYLAVYIWKRTA